MFRSQDFMSKCWEGGEQRHGASATFGCRFPISVAFRSPTAPCSFGVRRAAGRPTFLAHYRFSLRSALQNTRRPKYHVPQGGSCWCVKFAILWRLFMRRANVAPGIRAAICSFQASCEIYLVHRVRRGVFFSLSCAALVIIPRISRLTNWIGLQSTTTQEQRHNYSKDIWVTWRWFLCSEITISIREAKPQVLSGTKPTVLCTVKLQSFGQTTWTKKTGKLLFVVAIMW